MPQQPPSVKQACVQAPGLLRGGACPSQAWWHVLLQPGPFRHKLLLQACSLFTGWGSLEPQHSKPHQACRVMCTFTYTCTSRGTP